MDSVNDNQKALAFETVTFEAVIGKLTKSWALLKIRGLNPNLVGFLFLLFFLIQIIFQLYKSVFLREVS